MWRVWRKGLPTGAYWRVEAKDAEDAKKQIAREFKAKPTEFDASAPEKVRK